MGTFKWPLRISGIGRPTGPGHGCDGGRRGRLRRATIALFLTMLTPVFTLGCSESAPSEEALRDAVVTALDTLAADLLEDRPADVAAYTEHLQTYLEAHPSFFGSAAALLDRSGTVITSPYVYRAANGYASLDLAAPSYDIEAQDWFASPLAENASVWTDPYFDAGGVELQYSLTPISAYRSLLWLRSASAMLSEPISSAKSGALPTSHNR